MTDYEYPEPIRPRDVLCRWCTTPLEAWASDAFGAMRWRHVGASNTFCEQIVRNPAMPFDGWDAERKAREARQEILDDAREDEDLMDAETGGPLL